VRRMSEVANLSLMPPLLRPDQYLENHLRRASDLVIRAAAVEPALESTRKRIDSWRNTLGAMQSETPVQSFCEAPQGHRIRRRRPT